VVIDMAEATPLFRTLTQEQYFKSYSILDDEVIEKTKSAFERNKANGALTVSMIGFFEEGLSISLLTVPPDSAPTHSFFWPCSDPGLRNRQVAGRAAASSPNDLS